MIAPNGNVISHYLKWIGETTEEILKKVCKANGIDLYPKQASQLCPIPVFEDAPLSLLKTANIRTPTEILWPEGRDYEYLPAYFKRYRQDGRLRNQVVVLTKNYCYGRFFAAKELMHCFLDDDGYAPTNTIALVNDLIESLTINAPSLADKPAQTIVDQIALLGALEYLIPSSWLPMIRTLHSNISEKMPTVDAQLQIALILRVPKYLLQVRMARDRDSE